MGNVRRKLKKKKKTKKISKEKKKGKQKRREGSESYGITFLRGARSVVQV